jgi:hypothetical protein
VAILPSRLSTNELRICIDGLRRQVRNQAARDWSGAWKEGQGFRDLFQVLSTDLDALLPAWGLQAAHSSREVLKLRMRATIVTSIAL